MQIVLYFITLIVGFALLIKGADIFVDSSVNIAKRLKIPNIIIGLTIVTAGTGAPEIVISVSAAIGGSSDMAIGNIVGSNIFNLILVVGVCAFVTPIVVKFKDILREFFIGLGAAVLLVVMKFVFNDTIPRFGAFILLALYLSYMVFFVRDTIKNRQTEENNEGDGTYKPLSRSILFVIFGLAIIISGGQIAVASAVNVALTLGMTERVVGLTILAIGTSLPELVTSLIACKKGNADIALGNIFGSSVFNILLILGITGLILPLTIDFNLIFDLLFLIAGSFVFILFAYTGRKIVRFEGFLLVAAYTVYVSIITLT